jgi:hypothetical protein
MNTVKTGWILWALAIASFFMFMAVASAEEELPSEFYMNYTPDVQLVLEYDQCDKSDVSRGWSAYAVELSTQRKATGCWLYSQEETVTLHISLGVNAQTGGEEFLDYRLFKSKFTPRYKLKSLDT